MKNTFNPYTKYSPRKWGVNNSSDQARKRIQEPVDIYDDEYIEELLEDDEISPEEEAFMIGYND